MPQLFSGCRISRQTLARHFFLNSEIAFKLQACCRKAWRWGPLRGRLPGNSSNCSCCSISSRKFLLQRERVNLTKNKCRRQLLYSIVTSLTPHLGSNKLDVLHALGPLIFFFLFLLSPSHPDHGGSYFFLPSPAVFCCPLAPNKSKWLIVDIAGLIPPPLFQVMKDAAQMSPGSASPADYPSGIVAEGKLIKGPRRSWLTNLKAW